MASSWLTVSHFFLYSSFFLVLFGDRILLADAAGVPAEITDCPPEQLNRAKLRFKDCLEGKKARLLQLDYEQEDQLEDDLSSASRRRSQQELQLLICAGLEELSTGCSEAVDEFSFCMGREHVHHLVDIHLNAISNVMAPYHPSLQLRDCSVFNKPPPIVYKKPEPEATKAAQPEYQPVTGGSGKQLLSASVALMAALYILV